MPLLSVIMAIDMVLTFFLWVVLQKQSIFFSPVFNFADSCVTVGAFYLILFQWKFFSDLGKK